MTAAPVYLRADLKQPALLRFVEASALHHCTTVERHPNGNATVTPRWDPAGFSTGERVLWRLEQINDRLIAARRRLR